MVPSTPYAGNHRTISRAAPVGGLNFRDPFAAMPPGDARKLTNVIPDVGGLRVRGGFKEWATNFADDLPVRSIHAYASQTYVTGSPGSTITTVPGKLFAATDDGLYDITDKTDAPAISQALAGTDRAGECHSTMLTNSAGAYLLVCSEVDGYIHYNGTVWDTTPGVTGVSEGDLVYPLVWKRRACFVERDSTSMWYLGTDLIAGAASEFDFGPLFKHGGYLSYLASWTIDAGEGIDDMLVAVSSSGDVLVYRGTNPSSDFALVGSWFIGQIPVGRRGHCQYGGDLLLLSLDGLMPVSFVTRGGSGLLQASNKEYSSKIRAALNTDMRSSLGNVGWGMFLHPTERILVVNIPDYSGVSEKQYVMSTTANSWCEFSNIPMLSFCLSYGYAFAGTEDGRVLQLFTGHQDDVLYDGTGGADITSIIQPAFEYFDAPVESKAVLMIRPLFISYTTPTVEVGISLDFNGTVYGLTDVMYPEVSEGALWDIGLWDSGLWSDEISQFYEWMDVVGEGVSVAAYIQLRTRSATTFLSVDYMLHVGGGL